MTPTIEDMLARLAAEADAYRARAGRIDARLWQLERRGADLHGLRERLRAAAEAIGRLSALCSGV
jgi:hypothetical protein